MNVSVVHLNKCCWFVLGERRSDIQDRYLFDTGIFCWIGVSVWRDLSKFNILHSYYRVFVKPQKSLKHIINTIKFLHHICCFSLQ